jgi:membrane protein DedA with SNARE-associated domain
VSTACGALLGFLPGLLTSWIGMCAGSLLGYWLGVRFPAERFLAASDIERLESTHRRYGDWMLVVFRAVPVVAEASVFFAGLTRRPFGRFLLITTLSNFGISLAYAATGAFAAKTDTFLYAFAGAIGIPAVAMLLTRNRS